MKRNLEKLLTMMYVQDMCLMPDRAIQDNIHKMVSGSFTDKVPIKWRKVLNRIDNLGGAELHKYVWDLYLVECGMGLLHGFGFCSKHGDSLGGNAEIASVKEGV